MLVHLVCSFTHHCITSWKTMAEACPAHCSGTDDDEEEDFYLRKDMRSLGALCSRVRCAAKSSVTWLGSPPGSAAHMGQICRAGRGRADAVNLCTLHCASSSGTHPALSTKNTVAALSRVQSQCFWIASLSALLLERQETKKHNCDTQAWSEIYDFHLFEQNTGSSVDVKIKFVFTLPVKSNCT